MTFTIRKASDVEYRETIEINTLEALMEFVVESEHGVIIDANNTITIYDDLLE